MKVLVASRPGRMVAFVFDDDDRCTAVTTGTTTSYIGEDFDEVKGAMYSVLRYEDGTEPQPNTGHSANGFPTITVVCGDEATHGE